MLARYILPLLDQGADTLVLGCTHYPLLRPLIQRIVGQDLTVIDSAETTAARVKRVLARNGLDAADAGRGQHQIYVTGSAGRFAEVAGILFGQDLPPIASVRLELVEGMSGREGAA